MQVKATVLRETAEHWFATLASGSPHTARAYRPAVVDFLEGLPAGGLTERSLAEYVQRVNGNGHANATVAQRISAVRSYLRFARSLGVIPVSVESLLRRPKVQVTSRGRYLNLDEMRAVVAAARDLSPRHYAVVLTLFATGIRVSELSAAEWRDIYVDGSGRRGLLVRHGKGDKEREVGLTADAFAALGALHGSDKLSAKDRAPLVASTHATRYGPAGSALTPNALWRLFTAAVRASGIDKPASCHWARHSHFTAAARADCPPETMQRAAGHASGDTTRQYIHWAKGLDDTSANYIPSLT